jgi:hypothetical protein
MFKAVAYDISGIERVSAIAETADEALQLCRLEVIKYVRSMPDTDLSVDSFGMDCEELPQ